MYDVSKKEGGKEEWKMWRDSESVRLNVTETQICYHNNDINHNSQ